MCVVNECLYDENPALHTGQAAVLGHGLAESHETPVFAVVIANLCSL